MLFYFSECVDDEVGRAEGYINSWERSQSNIIFNPNRSVVFIVGLYLMHGANDQLISIVAIASNRNR